MPFLFELLVMLVVVGFGIWLLGYLPIAEPYKGIIKGVILFVVIIFLLYALFAYMPSIQFPPPRR